LVSSPVYSGESPILGAQPIPGGKEPSKRDQLGVWRRGVLGGVVGKNLESLASEYLREVVRKADSGSRRKNLEKLLRG